MKPPTLLPHIEGLHVDYLTATGDTIVVHMSACSPCACCQSCGHPSGRIHSHYHRTLADLPWAHCNVHIHILVRKFFCDNPDCKRHIFTEPLPELAAPYARKTNRLQAELYLIGYSLGGRAGAKEADGLGREVSPDTLLRRVRADSVSQNEAITVKVVGVDDWAFRKGHHYGTILIDLERHCPIDLLPDREAKSLSDWLKAHPGVEILSRDRASAYSQGAAEGAPDAKQVADRFHLLQNLVDALENLLGCNHASLRRAADQVNASVPTTPPEPESPQLPPAMPATPAQTVTTEPDTPPTPTHHTTKGQKQSAWRREKRLARFTEVRERHAKGESLLAIAQSLGLSRNTVSRYVHAIDFPERAKPHVDDRKIAPFATHLRQVWDQGCHNIAELYRQIKEQGYSGTYQGVCRYLLRAQLVVTGLPRSPTLSIFATPSARSSTWLLLLEEKPRQAQEEAFISALCEISPEIAQARKLGLEFFSIVHNRRAGELDTWMARVQQSGLPELQSFAHGLVRDKAAVLAALSEPWSNGQTEGQVNRLKLVKRSMYGQANFDLLRARVLPMTAVA